MIPVPSSWNKWERVAHTTVFNTASTCRLCRTSRLWFTFVFVNKGSSGKLAMLWAAWEIWLHFRACQHNRCATAIPVLKCSNAIRVSRKPRIWLVTIMTRAEIFESFSCGDSTSTYEGSRRKRCVWRDLLSCRPTSDRRKHFGLSLFHFVSMEDN
jgi:hypothetical protein